MASPGFVISGLSIKRRQRQKGNFVNTYQLFKRSLKYGRVLLRLVAKIERKAGDKKVA